LIEDVTSTLDPLLDPLIQKQFFKGPHGRVLINLGGQVFDYDKRFKLYLSMRDPNPHLLPEIFMKLSVINFTVT
jgi:dynein heavy chain, axonemal